jgi:nucleotide-binding universal stress UspA family protein
MLTTEKHGWIRPASIVVATDLVDIDRLFPVALDRATETAADLSLLHVLTPTSTIFIDPNGLPFYDPKEACRSAEKSLEAYKLQAESAGLNCTLMLREGAVAQQIVAATRQLGIDLLILGTRTRNRLSKLLLGSVAEQVLRSVPVPVLTIGPEVRRSVIKESQRTILLATTLREGSEKSAILACQLANNSNAKLVLVHVLPASASGKTDTSELTKYAKKELLRLIPNDLFCTCSPEPQVAIGNPSIEILAKAVECKADIIVLGASKASTLQRLARDGTVYRVLAHSPCPVLTILEQGPAESETDAQEAVNTSS